MKIITKRIGIVLSGIAYGILSFWWFISSYIMISHPDSSPGTKEWPEDVTFIPVGYTLIVLWIVISIAITIRNRKNKWNIIIFWGTIIMTLVVTFFKVIYFESK